MVGTVSRPGGRGGTRSRRGRSGLRRAGCWCEPGRGDLSVQGNREQTADGPGNRAQARVKRCGKSAPASGATSAARQPPPGARSNVGGPARPHLPRWTAQMDGHPSATARDPRTEPRLQAGSPSPPALGRARRASRVALAGMLPSTGSSAERNHVNFHSRSMRSTSEANLARRVTLAAIKRAVRSGVPVSRRPAVPADLLRRPAAKAA